MSLRYCMICKKWLDSPQGRMECLSEHGEMVIGDIPLSKTVPEMSPVYYFSESWGMQRIICWDEKKGEIYFWLKGSEKDSHPIGVRGIHNFPIPSGFAVYVPAPMHQKSFLAQLGEQL